MDLNQPSSNDQLSNNSSSNNSSPNDSLRDDHLSNGNLFNNSLPPVIETSTLVVTVKRDLNTSTNQGYMSVDVDINIQPDCLESAGNHVKDAWEETRAKQAIEALKLSFTDHYADIIKVLNADDSVSTD